MTTFRSSDLRKATAGAIEGRLGVAGRRLVQVVRDGRVLPRRTLEDVTEATAGVEAQESSRVSDGLLTPREGSC